MAKKTRSIKITHQCLHEGESLRVGQKVTLPEEEAGYLVHLKRAVYADGEDPKVENRDPKRA
jgi:hypothetical protein